VLACLAVAAGRARGVLSAGDENKLVHALIEVPRLMAEALRLEPAIEHLARDLAKCSDVLYLGRGTSYRSRSKARSSSRKSPISTRRLRRGELKHGPIALIDEKMPVIVIAPHDRVFEKTLSNIQEVAARAAGHPLTDPRRARGARESLSKLVLPEMPATVTPLVYAIPVQLIAYHTAVSWHRRRPAPQPGEIGHG